METSETLIKYEDYNDNVTGQTAVSRIATVNMAWMIRATNNKLYCIKFEKNFGKKHLYTSSKKTDKVLAEAKILWDAESKSTKRYWILLRGYWVSYPPVFMQRAQQIVDEKKFIKQVGHRSTSEQSCYTCGHKFKSHKIGGCKASGCSCTTFVSKYGHGRQTLGKPTVNPLSGATTKTNTVIVMNKIPKTTMEKIITDAIIAKENQLTLAKQTWGASSSFKDEKIRLDFGSTLKGCVMTIKANQPSYSDWVKQQGVEVSVTQLPTTDINKPVYTIGHLHGAF